MLSFGSPAPKYVRESMGCEVCFCEGVKRSGGKTEVNGGKGECCFVFDLQVFDSKLFDSPFAVFRAVTKMSYDNG